MWRNLYCLMDILRLTFQGVKGYFIRTPGTHYLIFLKKGHPLSINYNSGNGLNKSYFIRALNGKCPLLARLELEK